MINPKMHKKGSPEWVLAKFFEAWKNRAWKQMVDYIWPPWLRIYVEPREWLKLTFNPELIDARLIQASGRTPAVTEYLVEIEYRDVRVITKKVVSKIRLYSEMTSLQKTVWGVDPATIILEVEPVPIPKAEPKPIDHEGDVFTQLHQIASESKEKQKKVAKKKKKR